VTGGPAFVRNGRMDGIRGGCGPAERALVAELLGHDLAELQRRLLGSVADEQAA
jgi:hypothetical protein